MAWARFSSQTRAERIAGRAIARLGRAAAATGCSRTAAATHGRARFGFLLGGLAELGFELGARRVVLGAGERAAQFFLAFLRGLELVLEALGFGLGIEPGDRILSIAGRDTSSFSEIFNAVAIRPNEQVNITVQRGETVRELDVLLGSGTIEDVNGQQVERGLLGIGPSFTAYERVPAWNALPMATAYTWSLTRSIFDGLVQLIRGAISPKQLGGPIKIAQIAGEGAAAGLLPFIQLLALLSINLGFINLLPVPMLDGGHLALYTIEAVRRRPLSERALEWTFRGGLAVILALVVFTTVNDLDSIGLWEGLQRLIG